MTNIIDAEETALPEAPDLEAKLTELETKFSELERKHNELVALVSSQTWLHDELLASHIRLAQAKQVLDNPELRHTMLAKMTPPGAQGAQ